MAPLRSGRVSVGKMSLNYADEVCCLGDIISAGGGAEASSEESVRGWKEIRKLLPLLTMEEISLCGKRKLNTACVRCTVLYKSETWISKADAMCKLEQSEMHTVRWRVMYH